MTPPHHSWNLGNRRKKTDAEKPVYLFNSQKAKAAPSESWWTKYASASASRTAFVQELAQRFPNVRS